MRRLNLLLIVLLCLCPRPVQSQQRDQAISGGSGLENDNRSQRSINVPLIIRTPNSTPNDDGGTLVVQNSSSDARSVYKITIPENYLFADNIRSTVRLENGSGRSVQHIAAYGAYVYNRCSWGKAPHECNGVGLFAQGIAGTETAQTWPLNTACNDNGHASSCGNEHDVTVQNGAAVYTLWSGIIQGAVQPGNANGIQLSQVPRAVAQWTYGFVTNNGAAQNFGSVGAMTNGGINVSSQPLWFNGFDSARQAYAVKIQSAEHGLNVIDNTLPDGLALMAGHASVGIAATGSSTNTDMVLAAKGQGRVLMESPLKLEDASIWSKSGLVAASDLDINSYSLRNVGVVEGRAGSDLIVACAGTCTTYVGSGQIHVVAVDGKHNTVYPGNSMVALGEKDKPWAETNTKILSLAPIPYKDLPRCDGSSSGAIAYINDARDPITAWHQIVKDGGGGHTAFVSCNGLEWHAFDY